MVCCYRLVFSQGLNSDGREFYLGHINAPHAGVITTLAANQYRVYAIISSYTDQDVSVSYFNPQTGVETQPTQVAIDAYRSVAYPLDNVTMRMTLPGDMSEFRSCHIVARDPITVHYYAVGACTGGGYLALPVTAWGQTYVVATDADNPGYGAMTHPPYILTAETAGGCFLIIGAVDGTIVTISPNARTGGGHPGATQGSGATGTPQPYTITLNRGQCYLVRSASAESNNDDDMSGSIVKANKPIAVISAHENASPGDGIVSEAHETDARDFMIEQAMPWEFAAGSGNFSIPMADSKGELEGGYGEDVRVFVADNDQASTVSFASCGSSAVSQNIFPYTVPAVARANATVPMEISSDTTKRIQVVQYELRSDGIGSPWTTPSMMNIVPAKCWRNAYLWFIPQKMGILTPDYQEYFVTIVSNAPVTLAVNAGNPQPVEQVLKTVAKKWNCLAPNSNYTATTYKFSPNTSYYARSDRPFMVYVFGYTSTEIAPPGPDPITEYSGFAFPAGMRGKVGGTANIDIQVNEECGVWNICAVDKNGGGIRSLTLLRDPDGNFLSRNDLSNYKFYDSYNCAFERAPSVYGYEVTQLIKEQQFCAKLVVSNPAADAYAAVAVTDVNGNFRIVELNYYADIGQPSTTSSDLGSFLYGDSTSTIVTKRFKSATVIKTARMRYGKHFSVTPMNTLPHSLVINEPIDFTITFAPKDTGSFLDTLIISDGCRTFAHAVKGKGVTGLIYANDVNLGAIAVGKTRTDSIRIENRGTSQFTINSASVSGSSDLIVDVSTLPVTLMPGAPAHFKVTYGPQSEGLDTANIIWSTDLKAPFERSIKSFSTVIARSIEQSVSSGTKAGLTIVPNPTTGDCALDLRSLSGEATISLYNLLGVECYRITAEAGANVELRLPALASGQYRMRVDIKNESYDIPIIIGSLR